MRYYLRAARAAQLASVYSAPRWPTTLLMAAILLAGIIGYRFLPVAAFAEVDYPRTIQVVTLYRRQPGCHDLRRHRAQRGASSARCQD
ncbi:hypothetical protein KCP71_16175 [Salmonella enterica subsp. enterica]|nr:hypothetical protein KCP71_16175 [Salmonella enterica subsp. enterica]